MVEDRFILLVYFNAGPHTASLFRKAKVLLGLFLKSKLLCTINELLTRN